jgi:hypothetical protein
MQDVSPSLRSSASAASGAQEMKVDVAAAAQQLGHKRVRDEESTPAASADLQSRPPKQQKTANDRTAGWTEVEGSAMQESKYDDGNDEEERKSGEGGAASSAHAASSHAAAAATASHAVIKCEAEDVEQYKTSKVSRDIVTAVIVYDAMFAG